MHWLYGLLVWYNGYTPHIIRQVILIIFQSSGKIGRHKETFIKTIDILRSCDPGKIRGRAIRIHILSSTIITVASCMLCRSIYTQPLFLIRREIIKFRSPLLIVCCNCSAISASWGGRFSLFPPRRNSLR